MKHTNRSCRYDTESPYKGLAPTRGLLNFPIHHHLGRAHRLTLSGKITRQARRLIHYVVPYAALAEIAKSRQSYLRTAASTNEIGELTWRLHHFTSFYPQFHRACNSQSAKRICRLVKATGILQNRGYAVQKEYYQSMKKTVVFNVISLDQSNNFGIKSGCTVIHSLLLTYRLLLVRCKVIQSQLLYFFKLQRGTSALRIFSDTFSLAFWR